MCFNIIMLCDLIIVDCVKFKYYHIFLHFKFFASKKNVRFSKLIINVRLILVKIWPKFKWGQSICWLHPPPMMSNTFQRTFQQLVDANTVLQRGAPPLPPSSELLHKLFLPYLLQPFLHHRSRNKDNPGQNLLLEEPPPDLLCCDWNPSSWHHVQTYSNFIFTIFVFPAYSYFCISYLCVSLSLCRHIVSIFWEIAALVSTALASTALVSTATVSYTHRIQCLNCQMSIVHGY